MDAKAWRRAEALRRIHRAMDNVQRAQDELDRACGELSALRYGHPAQLRVGKLRERVHAEWYRVQKLLDHPRVEMDRDPRPDELAAATAAQEAKPST